MPLTREEKIALLNKKANAINPDAKWKQIAKWNEEHADALEDYTIIAMKILQSLKSKKMTQRELADNLNVKPQALTRIMKGRQNLSINTVRKIERVLKISLLTIPKIEEVSSQIRTRMVAVNVHYNHSKNVFSGAVNTLQVSSKQVQKKLFGNLSIAS